MQKDFDEWNEIKKKIEADISGKDVGAIKLKLREFLTNETPHLCGFRASKEALVPILYTLSRLKVKLSFAKASNYATIRYTRP